jgi:hypothetical protein
LKFKLLLTKFRNHLPDWVNDFHPKLMSNVSDEDMVRAMQFCRLMLGRIKNQLHDLVTLAGKNVILWFYWTLIWWLVQQGSHPFLILSKSESMSELK